MVPSVHARLCLRNPTNFMQTRRLRNSGPNNYLLISNGEQPVKTLNRNGCFFYCSNTAVNVTPFWAGHTERENKLDRSLIASCIT